MVLKRIALIGAAVLPLFIIGCESAKLPTQNTFRGNPISELPADGVLRASGSPYLAVDTLRVAAGQALTIESGVELRFEPGIPFEVSGTITALGTENAPIVFTSGQVYPSRGDWDGIWLTDADPASEFRYCKFLFGAKYGRRYHYRTNGSELDSTVWEYGSLTCIRSSPKVIRCWFIAGGFHGVHCDSSSTPTVENCVFYDNAGHGIFVHWTADPVIRYNIISENDDYGLFCKEPTETPRGSLQFEYNLLWSNFSGEYGQQAPSQLGRIAGTNGNLDSCDFQSNLRLDPAFLDGANWDLRLNAWSAAIDAGDEAGERDPDGTRLELGLYRYQYRPGEIRRRVPNEPIVGNRLEAANSPYFMSCDVLLPAGETLTIEHGVEVLVEGRFLFRALGTLKLEGKAGAPIRFVSAADEPDKGDWLGILLDAGGDTGSVLKYVEIANATTGLQLNRRDALIENCTVRDCNIYGIFCNDFSSPNISGCTITDNSTTGIYCRYGSSPVIKNCVITGGFGYGIHATGRSLPVITNNIIAGIGTDGIRLEDLSDAQIINNTIAGNGYFGMVCENNASPDVRNNIFYSNGTTLGGIGIKAELTSRPTVEYNCFWGHPVSAVNISGITTLPATNLSADPAFISAANRDYRLQSGSPCINAGDPSALYNDRDESQNDLGAYGGPGGN